MRRWSKKATVLRSEVERYSYGLVGFTGPKQYPKNERLAPRSHVYVRTTTIATFMGYYYYCMTAPALSSFEHVKFTQQCVLRRRRTQVTFPWQSDLAVLSKELP